MSTQTTDPYREQARELEEALGKVKGIQEQIASVTQQRETLLQQRQTLLDSFEDESAVAELSKISVRTEMADAKFASLAAKLVSAESDLRQSLDGFGYSCHVLHGLLRSFLCQDAKTRILALLHPTVRAISGGRISEIVGLATEVIEVEKLKISTLRDFFVTNPNAADVKRLAEESLSKVDTLLAAAAKYPGFVPPPVAKPLAVTA